MDVKFHKGWGTICKYVCKEDRQPLVWGEFSLQQILETALTKKRKAAGPTNKESNDEALMQRLESKENWLDSYE